MNKIKSFEGDILYYNNEKDIGNFLKLYQGLDPHFKKQKLYHILDQEIDISDNILDIGAQIGNMSLFLARRCNKVYAFEPLRKS